jgi:hypothetical protein
VLHSWFPFLSFFVIADSNLFYTIAVPRYGLHFRETVCLVVCRHTRLGRAPPPAAPMHNKYCQK